MPDLDDFNIWIKTMMFEPDDFPRPNWATGTTSGEIALGAQLCTRDGRRIGNAVVIAWPIDRHGLFFAEVLTDAGTTLALTVDEVNELYWPPKWLMDPATAPGHTRAKLPDSASR